MTRKQSHGQCYLCKGTFSKGSMTRHLTNCLLAHEKTAAIGKARTGKLFRVVVEGADLPEYWLHLEIPATAKLKYIDQVLRTLWLECCGHLSAFKFEGKKNRAAPRSFMDMLAAGPDEWRDPDEVDMEKRVGDIFEIGTKLSYEYDFGSTTSLSLKVAGEREGLIVKPNDVTVLARNDPPEIPCGLCGKAQATIIDMDYYDESRWHCAKCAKKADLEMSLPVVNSPRTGVCGYTGS